MAADGESTGKSKGRAGRRDEADVNGRAGEAGVSMSMSWRPFQRWCLGKVTAIDCRAVNLSDRS